MTGRYGLARSGEDWSWRRNGGSTVWRFGRSPERQHRHHCRGSCRRSMARHDPGHLPYNAAQPGCLHGGPVPRRSKRNCWASADGLRSAQCAPAFALRCWRINLGWMALVSHCARLGPAESGHSRTRPACALAGHLACRIRWQAPRTRCKATSLVRRRTRYFSIYRHSPARARSGPVHVSPGWRGSRLGEQRS